MHRFGMFGKMIASEGHRDELVQYLLHAAELVSDAPGCELYIVSIVPTEPDAIWVSEAWRSQEDHDRSLTLPGVGELIAKARPLIVSMPEHIITTPIGGKGLPSYPSAEVEPA